MHSLTRFFIFLLLVVAPIRCQENREEYDMDEFFDEAKREMVKLKHTKWVKPENSRKMIYFQAEEERVRPSQKLRDDYFNIAPEGAVRMKRNTEYCQWKQRKSITPVSNEKGVVDYHYDTVWSKELIDSSKFFDSQYENPDIESFSDDHISTSTLLAGAYKLHQILVMKLRNWRFYKPTADALTSRDYLKTTAFRRGFVNFGGQYFYKFTNSEKMYEMQTKMRQWLDGEIDDDDTPSIEDGNNCEAGDIRISFEVVMKSALTVLAKQKNARGDVGDASSLRLITEGLISSDELFAYEKDRTNKAVQEMEEQDQAEIDTKNKDRQERDTLRKEKRKNKPQKVSKKFFEQKKQQAERAKEEL